MTQKRRPKRAARTTRTAKKPPRSGPQKQAAAIDRKPPRNPLDDYIGAAAIALDLNIEPAWLPAVRENLRVILHLGASVSKFQLRDDTEPAPIFQA